MGGHRRMGSQDGISTLKRKDVKGPYEDLRSIN